MQVNLVPPIGISPLLGHEEDRTQAAEPASSSKRAGKLTTINAVPDFSPRPPSSGESAFAANDDDNLAAKRAQYGARKSVAFAAGSLKNLAGPPTFDPPAVLRTRTPSAQSLRPIFKSVTLNDGATVSNGQKPPEAIVPARFGQRAKSSQNLRATPFTPSASVAQMAPLLPPGEPAYTTTASSGSLARGRRLSSSGAAGIASALSGQQLEHNATANPGSLARGRQLSSSGAAGMPSVSSGLIKSRSVGADVSPLERSASKAGSSDVLRIAPTNLRVLTGANSLATDSDSDMGASGSSQLPSRRKSMQLEAAFTQLNDAAAGDLADREQRLAANQGVFLPIIAPANANRVLPSASGGRAGQWLPSESNDGEEETQDVEDARDQYNEDEPPSNRAISSKSRSFVLSPSPPKEPRPRGNSLKWGSDGGARKMNKPIWKPGGMDETAKAEFIKNKERARAVISAIGKRKPRTASDKENDEREPDETETEPEQPLEPQPPLALVPHPPKKYKFDRKNVKFTIETPGSRPGSGLLDLEGRNLPPLPITSILMYDPPPIRSALRLSRPPKTRIRADGTVEIPDEKAVEPEPNMAHSLRTDFIRDFTLLSSHDTTQQDIEMQAMLRDVDAIGVSRAGWSSKAEMYNISPDEVQRMCKIFYTYLKSERLVQRGGVFGNDLGGMVVQVIGSSGSSAMISFLKEQIAGLDRGRYLYAKAMVGHISRLAALPLEINLLPHLAAALAPLLLPHQLVRPEKEPMTPLIYVHDDRPIPGFRFRPPSPPLQSPAIFPFSFFPPVPAVTAAVALLADEAEAARRASEDVAFGGVGAASEGEDAAVVPVIMPLDPAATALMVMAENYDAIFGGARGNG
ncbi:hypothetical protein HDU90_004909 [Geranomyces variabilis]|nr:hypothetical protein HDU90_004909 [Geranomyces variabilis]